jgi:hypothetical protein
MQEFKALRRYRVIELVDAGKISTRAVEASPRCKNIGPPTAMTDWSVSIAKGHHTLYIVTDQSVMNGAPSQACRIGPDRCSTPAR